VTESGDQPIFRDRRRIDPETGEVREPQGSAAPGPRHPDQAADQAAGSPAQEHRDPSMDPDAQASGQEASATAEVDRVSELEASLAERTVDLQRLQAEYVNYKRRVDRDREVVREGATASVLTSLLPVLDDIDRAREHGELEGGFKAVADSFTRIVEGLGLERFGKEGEPFDPRIHEALMHQHADGIDGPTCTAILQPGYRIGERIIRPARVAVAEPSTDPAGAAVDTQAAESEQSEQSGQTDAPPDDQA
jgi:molecular chaperone GrpE